MDFDVTNPADNPQQLTSVTVSVALPNGEPWVSTPVGCTAADYDVVSPAFVPVEIPGGSAVSVQATITMRDTGVNQDICQGQTVPLYILAE